MGPKQSTITKVRVHTNTIKSNTKPASINCCLLHFCGPHSLPITRDLFPTTSCALFQPKKKKRHQYFEIRN